MLGIGVFINEKKKCAAIGGVCDFTVAGLCSFSNTLGGQCGIRMASLCDHF